MPTEDTEETDRSIKDKFNPYYGDSLGKSLGIRVGTFTLFLALLYYWRPLVHGIVYSMRFSPEGLIIGTVSFLTLTGLWLSPQLRVYDNPTAPGWIPIPEGWDHNKPGAMRSLRSILRKVFVFLAVFLVVSLVYTSLSILLTVILIPILLIAAVVIPLYITTVDAESNGSDHHIKNQPITKSALAVFGIVLFLFTASLFWVTAAGFFTERAMATETMDNANAVTEFPEVNEENPRIAPRQVDSNQVKGSVSYRQHRLGESDVARGENGSMMWSYAIEPDGTRNKFIEEQRGVALSDMTAIDDRELILDDDTSFPIGEGMYFHRGAEWNLEKTDYWAEYNDESVRFTHDDEAYMSYAKTGHEWKVDLFLGFIPIPYTVPVADGVALINTDGDINHMSLPQARAEPVLDGQRLYPLDVTKQYMGSLGYREGIINQLPIVGSHENEIETADLPSGAGNSQPFIVDMEDETFSYIMTFEPYGSDTRGLDEVWFTNAETGELTYYETGEDQTLLGPERAMGIVRSQDSQTGWGDNFEVVEPVPTVIDGQLWWHSKVVPTDNLDITRNVFVSAHSGEAVELRTTDAVRDFIDGKDVENINETVDDVDKDPVDDDPDIAYILVIKNEDGEIIEEIEVAPEEEVTVVPEDNTEE